MTYNEALKAALSQSRIHGTTLTVRETETTPGRYYVSQILAADEGPKAHACVHEGTIVWQTNPRS